MLLFSIQWMGMVTKGVNQNKTNKSDGFFTQSYYMTPEDLEYNIVSYVQWNYYLEVDSPCTIHFHFMERASWTFC